MKTELLTLELLEELTGFASQVSTSTEVMIYCPYCNHHKPKLSVNIGSPEGYFQCFICSETGGFNKLKKSLVSSRRDANNGVKKNLETNYPVADEAINYLISRSIDNSTALKWASPGFSNNSVVFPYINPDHNFIIEGYKFRSLDPNSKSRYRLEGKHPGLYIDSNKAKWENATSVIIVEGEIDCLSINNYIYQYSNPALDKTVCLASTGVTNRNCISFLDQFDTIYVWFDNDKDTKVRKIVDKSKAQFLKELSTTQEGASIRLICPPKHVKDPNEYLSMGYSLDAFKALLKDSQPYLEGQVNRPATYYLDNMFEYLGDEVRTMGTPTLFDSVDEMLGGGKRLGELTALQAEAKTGKNTFYHCMMYRWLEAGIPIGYASRELSPDEEVLPNLLSLKYNCNAWKLTKNKLLTPKLIKQFKSSVEEWPLYFAHGYGVIDIDDIIRWVLELKKQKVQFFFIDHMHYCLHDPENSREISSFIRRLKQLCKEENIHIDIIIQPKYLGQDQKLGLSSLRGGSAIGQAIDNLFILKRHPGVQGYEESLSELSLEVARHKLAKPKKKCYYSYCAETTHLKEVDIISSKKKELEGALDNMEANASGSNARKDFSLKEE